MKMMFCVSFAILLSLALSSHANSASRDEAHCQDHGWSSVMDVFKMNGADADLGSISTQKFEIKDGMEVYSGEAEADYLHVPNNGVPGDSIVRKFEVVEKYNPRGGWWKCETMSVTFRE